MIASTSFTDDDASTSTAPSAAGEQPSFDLGKKLADRLREHIADRDRTKRRMDQETTQLNHLLKSAPKRPRDTKAALQQKAKTLERDRTSRSLPLAQEKALLRQMDATQKQIRQHGQVEVHQQHMRKKKAEIEASKEALRLINRSVAEIEKALSNVELGKKLGCLPSEVITREMVCPMKMLNWVVGKDGKNIKDIEESARVTIEVDKIRGKIRIRGSGSAAGNAILLLENYTKAVDEEVKLTSDVIAYLVMKQSEVLNVIKVEHPDVKIDLLSKVIMMRGHPNKVQKAKAHVQGVHVVSQTRLLVGRELSLVVGKVNVMSDKHGVVMDLSKDGADKSTLRIIGLFDNVYAAMSAVDKMLHENEELEESFEVNALLRSELLNKSGAGIKEFERSLRAALATDHPEAAGGVHLSFDRNASKEEVPKFHLKGSRCVIDRAKSLVAKKLDEFTSNVTSVNVPGDMIPTIIGKGGATINELRTEGKGATVEADAKSGTIKVYSPDADTRDAIRKRIDQIVAENQVGSIPIEKGSIGFVLGEPGKEVRAACSEIGCSNLTVSNDDTRLMIKGTNEQIEKASELLKDFLAKNHVEELDIESDDEPLLFMGGPDSILHKMETKHNVKANFRKAKGVLHIRGEADKTSAALQDFTTFLKCGNGMSICKFKVPEEALGGVIGKGGSNIAKLESDFEGVLIHVPRDNNTISIRGPEDMVQQCRIRLITTIATTRVNKNIDITPEQHAQLSTSDVMKKISRFTNVICALNETSIKVRGISTDVRDARANIKEFLTGKYHGYIDLESSQFSRVKSAIAKDSSHFQRIHTSTHADVTLEDSDCAIHISGKKSNVKKAKTSVMELLTFIIPSQLQMVKVHKSLFRSMGNPTRLAKIASESGASISVERDMCCVLIRSESSDQCDKAVRLVNELMKECQKLNTVMRFDTSEAWLLPIIIGKKGSTIQQLEKDTECSFEIFKDDVTVVISAESEEVVQAGKQAMDDIVDKARKECIFIELPESSMASFIGKGGAGIKQLSADHGVQIERPKKHPSTLNITGEEECVASAQSAILGWVKEWEMRNIGASIDVDERMIPSILGKGGETIRSIEKETGCKIDINRQKKRVTVRDGSDADREDAINKIQAIIDEEESKAAERAAAKAKLREEQADVNAKLGEEQSAKAKAQNGAENGTATPKPDAGATSEVGGVKDRSGEFAKKPVGMAEVTTDDKEKGFNPAIHGTEAGRQLFQWLTTLEVGDKIVDEVKDYPGDPKHSDSGRAAYDEDSHVITKRDEEGNVIGQYYQSVSGISVRL